MNIRIRYKHILTFIGMIIAVTIATAVYANTVPQEEVGQVHQQQESVNSHFIDKYPPETSFIVPSASDTVNVSVTVLENLSLSVDEAEPHYATNWPYGASIYSETPAENTTIWTATADY
ncbi:hypothetical protein ACFL0L_02675 [Patescibacteria group bacterium]